MNIWVESNQKLTYEARWNLALEGWVNRIVNSRSAWTIQWDSISKIYKEINPHINRIYFASDQTMFRKQKINWMKFKSFHIFSTKNNSKVATLDEKAQQNPHCPELARWLSKQRCLPLILKTLNDPGVPHSGRRKLAPTNCSLISICIPWHEGGSNPQYPRSSLVFGCSTQQMLFCLIDTW